MPNATHSLNMSIPDKCYKTDYSSKRNKVALDL